MQRFRQQRVGLEDAFADLVEPGEYENDDHHDEEGKLEAGLEKLAWLQDENDNGGGEKGIKEIAGPFQNPAAENDQDHDNGADGGGGPARHGGVEKQERNRQQRAEIAGNAESAQQIKKDSRNDGDAQAIDSENMICQLPFLTNNEEILQNRQKARI